MTTLKRSLWLAGIVLGAGVALFQVLGLSSSEDYISPDDTERVLRGRQVYAQNCAACHGAQLQGQPDWRRRRDDGRLPAPPHDASGHTWHHADDVLLDITRHGLVPGRTAPDGYHSDMPAYVDILSDDDIVAVIAYIKSTWPEAERQAQKEVTLQSRP
ncbi:c-type cytochrome [Alcaligenes sp. SDU_A2]|uniref:c-type cytochrome n=1 Tax=Alcaligenes sp. SDU_A2 TaxID=3136634 RepID=UPI00311EF6C4